MVDSSEQKSTEHPFGLPPGSIRALILILLVLGWISSVLFPGIDIPTWQTVMKDLLLLGFGYYFGTKRDI